MNACVIDWVTVWDVVKAVGQSITAVWAVRYAVTNFRKQKGIELRIDWHKRTHLLIAKAAELVAQAAEPESQTKETDREAARAAVDALITNLDERFVLAGQSSFEAFNDLNPILIDTAIHLQNHYPTVETAVHFATLCASVADNLARGFRIELGIYALKKYQTNEAATAKLLASRTWQKR